MANQLAFVKEQLALRTREEWDSEVAPGADVPFSTVKKIGYGQTPNPSAVTTQKLYDYFIRHRRRRSSRPAAQATAG